MCIHPTGRRLLSAALIFFAGATQSRADISVLISPEPAGPVRAIGLSSASLWSIRACNDGTDSVALQPERIFEAAPSVPFLETSAAQIILQQSHVRNRRVKIARYLEGAVVLATVITGGGVVAASSKVVVALALSASAAHQIGDLIQGAAPDLTAISSSLLAGPVTLSAGACTTRLALSDVQTDAKPVTLILK